MTISSPGDGATSEQVRVITQFYESNQALINDMTKVSRMMQPALEQIAAVGRTPPLIKNISASIAPIQTVAPALPWLSD